METTQIRQPQPVRRFCTGIPEIDSALDGGLPEKATILIMNDPENDASTFCQQLAWNGLKLGETVFYYTYDHDPDSIRRNMNRFGWDVMPYEEKGDLIIVDCYSGRIGERGKEKYWLEKPFEVRSLVELFRILERDLRLKRGLIPARGIVDSFSPIVEVVSFLDAVKLAIRIQSLVRKGAYLGLGVIHRGIHGTINEATAKHMSDGVIEMLTKEEQGSLSQYLRITKMALSNFSIKEFRYATTQDGLRILG